MDPLNLLLILNMYNIKKYFRFLLVITAHFDSNSQKLMESKIIKMDYYQHAPLRKKTKSKLNHSFPCNREILNSR